MQKALYAREALSDNNGGAVITRHAILKRTNLDNVSALLSLGFRGVHVRIVSSRRNNIRHRRIYVQLPLYKIPSFGQEYFAAGAFGRCPLAVSNLDKVTAYYHGEKRSNSCGIKLLYFEM
jgi:hypothetical protein